MPIPFSIPVVCPGLPKTVLPLLGRCPTTVPPSPRPPLSLRFGPQLSGQRTRISRLPLPAKELKKDVKKWNPSQARSISSLNTYSCYVPPSSPEIRTLQGTPGSSCTLSFQVGARPTLHAGPDRSPPTSKPGSRAALRPPSPAAPRRSRRPPSPPPRHGNWAPAPRGHLHPAAVGRRLLGTRPLAQAGLGSVSSPSGHRQLQL